MKKACPMTSLKDLAFLKKDLKTGTRTPPAKTDEEFFHEAMADVREIREFREIPFEGPKGMKPRVAPDENAAEVLRQIIRGERKMRLSDTGEYMEGTGPCVGGDLTRKLHRGEFAVQDSIDLHGMTLPEADEALRLFFREAVRRRLFCVKVIHGRGLRSPNGPVLKEAFRKLLHGQFRKWVLAYATAKDCDGGLGATYVILR
ncbi:MAG: Smr/MutS family protein [Nitrospirae bacterium]|nr:Smr/MutS family protein [Nitrospirota bacterium]